jgi:hypothetical protein
MGDLTAQSMDQIHSHARQMNSDLIEKGQIIVARYSILSWYIEKDLKTSLHATSGRVDKLSAIARARPTERVRSGPMHDDDLFSAFSSLFS